MEQDAKNNYQSIGEFAFFLVDLFERKWKRIESLKNVVKRARGYPGRKIKAL